MTDSNLCIMISSEIVYGTRYVTARVMQRRKGEDFPVGVVGLDDGFYDGLTMEGFVSEYSGFLMHDVRFLNVYAFDSRTMAKSLKVLQKVEKQIDKDEAREPGDMFRAFALALGIKEVCVTEDRQRPRTEWRCGKWEWLSAEQGRTLFRKLAHEAHEEWKASKGKQEVVA